MLLVDLQQAPRAAGAPSAILTDALQLLTDVSDKSYGWTRTQRGGSQHVGSVLPAELFPCARWLSRAACKHERNSHGKQMRLLNTAIALHDTVLLTVQITKLTAVQSRIPFRQEAVGPLWGAIAAVVILILLVAGHQRVRVCGNVIN